MGCLSSTIFSSRKVKALLAYKALWVARSTQRPNTWPSECLTPSPSETASITERPRAGGPRRPGDPGYAADRRRDQDKVIVSSRTGTRASRRTGFLRRLLGARPPCIRSGQARTTQRKQGVAIAGIFSRQQVAAKERGTTPKAGTWAQDGFYNETERNQCGWGTWIRTKIDGVRVCQTPLF